MANILLTGATRGIGAATMARLAGHAVVGTGSRDGDLADPASPARLWAQALDRLGGRIDVLIHNAAIFEAASIDLPDDGWTASWQRTMQANVIATGELCRLAVKHFRDHGGGRIVALSSRAAHRGHSANHWHYAASKAAVIAIVKSIARAYAAEGIYAWAICPGFTMTSINDEYLAITGDLSPLADIPLGRGADPSEVAEVIRFAALDAPPSMTGAVLDINGASYVR